ncbi:sensor domain-containing diguanylate cyclase [Marinobacter orientalis]|uniref:Diguanylate cyclase n=1 Tax=Marinobacter orientalis TaxID=1928859 RepID=A0A7Y0RDP7_9GAMM|nr:sensor domain-containing diguanylate cyclase [Marinobacter orientalis]NMT64318.1 diguanylate cyclase [Marinobacter orientalis]TGX49531.1 sensor domain-containing diguanylate cyclase [Marinobacter orientalis]
MKNGYMVLMHCKFRVPSYCTASEVPINSFVRASFTGISFFLGAWLGLTQTVTPDGIAVLWPANAVLLTVLLQTSQKEWPLLTVAALIAASLASISASFPLWSVALFGLVNIFEALLAAFLIRRFAGKDFEFQSLRDMKVFFLAAPVVACSASAFLGAAIYEALARTENTFFVFWRLWWFADAVGMVLLTPLLVSAWHAIKAKRQIVSAPQLAELAAIWSGIAITGIFAFRTARQADVEFFLAPVLLLGFVVWTAIRLGILATTGTVTLIAVLATAFLVQPTQFFSATSSPQDTVWLTQEYLVVMSIIAVGLSGLMQKIRHQHASLALQDRAMIASNDAISIVDVQRADTPIIWVNPKFEELFGYSAGEIVGLSWRLLQKGIRQQYNHDTVRAALADKTPCRAQLKSYTKAGKLLWIDFSMAPVRDPAGRVTHYIGIHHDLTQAKETEQRLKDATESIQRHNESLEEKVRERTALLQKANQELEKVASVDFLTGISNRRHFYELGQRELTRLGLDGRMAVLIAFDLDNFKAVNDTFGHEAGDQVLRQIVTPVENSIRPTDFFGRIGGDEFLILFADTSESKAVEIAERIRIEIMEILSPYGSASLRVTASVGVAEWDQSCDLNQLIRWADLALYQAKEEGGNRVRARQSSS